MEHYVMHMTAGELREMLRAAVRETLSERPQEVEQQSSHRMQLEDYALKEQLQQRRRGQTFGFILASLFMLSTTLLGMSGHDGFATAIATTIPTVVSVFVSEKREQKKTLLLKTNSTATISQ